MTGRRFMPGKLLLALTLLLTVSVTEAQTANSIPLIVKIAPAASLLRVLDWLTGKLVDSIPGSDIYLINVPKLPLVQPVLGLLTNTLQLVGIEWFEINNGVTEPSHSRWGVIQIASNTTADWYKNQPSFQLIRAGQARAYSTARGIVV